MKVWIYYDRDIGEHKDHTSIYADFHIAEAVAENRTETTVKHRAENENASFHLGW